MKKILILLILGGLFISCGEKSTANKKMKIGVAFANFNDTFLMTVKDGMQKYLKEQGIDADVTFVDAKEDTSTQMGQVENFVTQKVDAIIVIPVNTEATTPMTQLAISNKIPLIYVNRKPSGLPQGAYYVGSDDKSAGIIQGEYLAKILKGKGNIVILQGILANEGAIARTKGVKEIVSKNNGMKVTKIQTGNWDRAQGMSVMENWLSSGDQINALAANNDDMAIGALEAIKSAKKLGKIVVIGVDATPDGVAQIKAGNLNATVFQDGNGQGSGAIEKAINIFNNRQVEQVTMIPFQLVTPENADKFIKK